MYPQSPTEGEAGAYCFWCGSRRRRRSFLPALYLLNQGWILIKLAQTHYWDGEKKWLDVGDLGLIFKVTSALLMSHFDQKKMPAPYLLNQTMDSGERLCIVSLG